MATLKDISADLGLSVTTVSRALNGFPEVSERTRTLVQQAAQRLNYRPNRIAQKLVSGRSGMVGLIVARAPDPTTDPSFMEIATGLSVCLAERDIDLVFHVGTDPDPVAPYRRMVAKNTLDGFIVNAPVLDDPRIDYLRAEGLPFVVHGREAAVPDYAYFDIDNARAAADAVTLLTDLGHVRMAFLNGGVKQAFSGQRLAGFNTALSARGLHVPAAFITHGDMTEEHGYAVALAALSGRLGLPPTAFLCASTLVAAGVMRAVRDRGLSVPEDISVVAHDDALPHLRAINFTPSLTVTRAPLRDACRPLAEALVGRLAGVPFDRLQTTRAADLIIRSSVGPAPRTGTDPWT